MVGKKQIKLSSITAAGLDPDRFFERVKRLKAGMESWVEHMQNVKAGKAQEYPAPVEHPLVVSALTAVKDDVTGQVSVHAEYDVVDDGPSAQEKFEQKRAGLVNEVLLAEQRTRDLIDPPLRRRLRLRDVAEANRKRTPAEDEMIVAFSRLEAPSDYDKSFIETLRAKPTRTARDIAVLADDDQRRAQIDQLDEWVSHKLAEIHDLTIHDVDTWSLGDPPIKFE